MTLHGHEYGEQTSGKYVFVQADGRNTPEHRAVMTAALGRALLPEETVHHKGSARDNRPALLELRVNCDHPEGWSIDEALRWADEIIARYRPTPLRTSPTAPE